MVPKYSAFNENPPAPTTGSAIKSSLAYHMDGECFLKKNVVHGADTPDSCPTIKSRGQQLAPAFLSKPGAYISFYKLPEIVPFQATRHFSDLCILKSPTVGV